MLTLKTAIVEAIDASGFVIKDVSGDYDVTENPGGWGGSNTTKAAIGSVMLVITMPGDIVLLHEVTLSDWLNKFFTLGNNINYEVLASDLIGQDRWPDGYYNIRYIVSTAGTINPDSLVSGIDFFVDDAEGFVEQAYRSLVMVSAKIDFDILDDKQTNDLLFTNMVLSGAQKAATLSLKEQFEKLMDYLTTIIQKYE